VVNICSLCCSVEGLLNPLACPHHMSQSEKAEYREGVVLNKPVKEGRGSFVNVGLPKEIQIDRTLDAGLRVTVKMKPSVEGKCTNATATTAVIVDIFTCCFRLN